MFNLNKKLNKRFLKSQKQIFYINLSIAQESHRARDMENYIKRTAESFQNTQTLCLQNLLSKSTKSSTLIYGAAGTGKSTVTQKIASAWATRELWDDKFDLVFHFECRQMTSMIKQKQKINIENLLMKFHCLTSTVTRTGKRSSGLSERTRIA